MDGYVRQKYNEIVERIKEPRRFIQVLAGPRQVGKTTLVRQVLSNFVDNEKRWKRYVKDSLVAPSIEKDVLMTSNIYKPALMRQLFDIGCSYSGELLSLTKIVGQLQDAGNATTIAHYINILDECNLIAGLQKYAMDDARKYNSIPKFQVYNNALLTAFKGRSYKADRIDTEAWGRWVESAIGAHLLSQAAELDYKLFYWRERADEVDFIIKSQHKCIAIEVKSGRRGTNKGLPLFEKTFHPDLSFVVGTGGVDIETFLKSDVGRLL